MEKKDTHLSEYQEDICPTVTVPGNTELHHVTSLSSKELDETDGVATKSALTPSDRNPEPTPHVDHTTKQRRSMQNKARNDVGLQISSSQDAWISCCKQEKILQREVTEYQQMTQVIQLLESKVTCLSECREELRHFRAGCYQQIENKIIKNEEKKAQAIQDVFNLRLFTRASKLMNDDLENKFEAFFYITHKADVSFFL